MFEKNPSYNIHLLEKIIETQSILIKAQFNLEDFMQLVAQKVQELTPATGAVIELVEDEFMVYKAVSGTVVNYHQLRIPMQNSISGLCILQNQVLICQDTEQDARVNLEACRKVLARSLVVAPLFHAGKSVGVIKILSRYPNAFDKLHIKILEIMASLIASGLNNQIIFEEKEKTITKLKEAQKRLSYLSKHDFLTKLPNRQFFETVLHHAMDKVQRKKGLIALMILDIDHFKWVNDNLGHPVGDQLLVKFAEFLKQNVRKYDFIVRLGGDEFVILLDDLQEKEEAIKIAEKIIYNLNQTLLLALAMPKISTSIGIAFYKGEGLSSTEYIKKADDALYEVKTAGRNGFRVSLAA